MSLLSTEHLQLGFSVMPRAKQAVCKQLGGRKRRLIVAWACMTAAYGVPGGSQSLTANNKLDRKQSLYRSTHAQVTKSFLKENKRM